MTVGGGLFPLQRTGTKAKKKVKKNSLYNCHRVRKCKRASLRMEMTTLKWR
jgi:hypothetical protein